MIKGIVTTDYMALSTICAELREHYDQTGDQSSKGALAAVIALNTEPSDIDDFFSKYATALLIAENN